MYVGLTSTTRDSKPSSAGSRGYPAQPRPAASRPATPETPDPFGPATRVDVSTADKPAARPRPNPSSTPVRRRHRDPDHDLPVQGSDDGTVVFQVPDEVKFGSGSTSEDMEQLRLPAATAGTHPDPSTIDSIRI